MDIKKYWSEKHKKYLGQSWIEKPTLFSQFAIKYFPEAGKLLDIGTGQGQDARFFSKLGYEVTATDISEEAISLAKEKDTSGTKYIYHDLNQNLPFENETFDIVYSHLTIQFFDNKTTSNIFSEIKRVLKNGGVLAIIVNTKDDPQVLVSKLLGEDLYEAPDGLVKRFYDEKSLSSFVSDKFEQILLDSKGETYKDETKTLIRYIGKKS